MQPETKVRGVIETMDTLLGIGNETEMEDEVATRAMGDEENHITTVIAPEDPTGMVDMGGMIMEGEGTGEEVEMTVTGRLGVRGGEETMMVDGRRGGDHGRGKAIIDERRRDVGWTEPASELPRVVTHFNSSLATGGGGASAHICCYNPFQRLRTVASMLFAHL